MGILKPQKKENVLLLSPYELMPNPLQPRHHFDVDDLNALCESIKIYGIIQPLAVKKIENLPYPMPKSKGKYEIIAGERRWRAAKMAGLSHVPCIIIEADRQESAFMALVENLQRSDLSYFEEALAIQTLMLMSGKPQTRLAKDLSISQSTLSNKLRLLKLSERERLMAIENRFSERHCRALVRVESEKERRFLMLKIIQDNLNAFETEKLIDSYLNSSNSVPVANLKPKKKKVHIKGSIKDIKLLYNTVEKAVKLLSNSGYNAKWEKDENNGVLEVKITVKQ